MPAASRLTIRSLSPDPRGTAIANAAAHHGLPLPGPVAVADVAFVAAHRGLTDGDRARLAAFLADPLLQHATWDGPDGPSGDGSGDGLAYEIAFHPGVTDTAATAIVAAAAALGVKLDAAATGRRVEFPPGTDAATIDLLLRRVVANPVIEHWAAGAIEPNLHPGSTARGVATVIPIRGLDDAGLAALNAERAMALDPAELVAIRDHFAAERRDPTDVELETLAQTWSEHCAHKTFRATITVDDGTALTPLLRRLRDCTESIAAPFVRSAFVGNAGIVEFTPGTTIALKAETHNHPSAVEPFGGANTGVGGVIRDVMGAGHKPFAVTDVLCFGPADTPADAVPVGALHPQRIIGGVIDGVADYGNKIGLPTVAGAVLYDHEYTTNPLVFCGCIGLAAGWLVPTGPHAGDRVVVLGGATGRDGIRGATFSSAAMDATTGEVAGASVQIGDPVTEKLLIDVLDDAGHRLDPAADRRLYTAITDCGAGGLSSAIGEMAEGVGAVVDLDAVSLKYPGLEPWEIWLSEAQERMVLAVTPDDAAELFGICQRRGVDFADVGEFTGDGRLVVRYRGSTVLHVDTDFLHDGRPPRSLRATLPDPVRTPATRAVDDVADTLLALLSHPNIASKAAVIHRYDHEIGGATLLRPLIGDGDGGHADGVVLARPGDRHGVAVGHGVNPWYGLHDPEAMAWAVVDEAIRNVVAAGGDPGCVALLDNFSWGDPLDAATLGQLAAAVEGCCAAALAYRAPFVSGKDSLNNIYTGADGRRHAVPPTLVVTAVAHVPDAEACVTPELVAPGNDLFVLGPTSADFAGSHLDLVRGAHRTSSTAAGSVPRPDAAAPARYRTVHGAIRDGLVASCHDVSEGGLAVAVAEMCIASRLGALIDALPGPDVVAALFGESAGRLVCEVAPHDAAAFVGRFGGCGPVSRLGTVTDGGVLRLGEAASIPVAELSDAFTRSGAQRARRHAGLRGRGTQEYS